MPQLSIITNHTGPEDSVSFRKQLSKKLSEWLCKPEEYCMIHTEFGAGLPFGGSAEFAATLEIASLGLSDDQPKQLSPLICEFLQTELGLSPDRVYIRFSSPPRTHWGWNSKTFG